MFCLCCFSHATSYAGPGSVVQRRQGHISRFPTSAMVPLKHQPSTSETGRSKEGSWETTLSRKAPFQELFPPRKGWKQTTGCCGQLGCDVCHGAGHTVILRKTQAVLMRGRWHEGGSVPAPRLRERQGDLCGGWCFPTERGTLRGRASLCGLCLVTPGG